MKGKRQSVFNQTNRFSSITTDRDDNTKKDDAREYATNDNPESFDGSFLTAYMQTSELERKINSVMGTLFEDYHGCIISVVQNNYNDIRVDLFFRPRRNSNDVDNDTRAFVSVDEVHINPNDSAILNAVRKNTAAVKRSSNFSLTDYASQILYDFLPNSLTEKSRIGGRTVDWKNPNSYQKANIVSELVDGSSQMIYACVTGLDIVKLVAFIYGEKDQASKSGNIYNVTPSRPASDLPSVLGSNWIISITKMTWADYGKIMKKLGVNPTRGTLPINTTRDE